MPWAPVPGGRAVGITWLLSSSPCSAPDVASHPHVIDHWNGTLMPSDLLSITLPAAGDPPAAHPAERLMPLDQSQRENLARLYLASYPPQVGAADLDDARREIDETFTGQFGTLRFDASWLAHACGRPAGAILVVERSIWDDHLDGPFVIDLFVHPEARGLGLGRSLGLAAMKSCSSAGDRQLSLRVGDGTSATAHGLYGRLGFVELT